MKSTTQSILCWALLSLVICAGTDGKTKTQTPTEQASSTQAEGSGDVLKTFRTYFVKSDTIYMKAGTLQRALEGRADFATWGLQAVNESKNADVIIEVQLPFLTWEWKYRMIQVPAGAVLATGKVKALTEDIAAPQLAAQIAERLNEVRGKPSNAKQEMDSLTVDREREAALPSKEWRVDYISGITDTELGKGTLTTNRDRITCRTRNGSSFTILAKDVVAVTHDSQKTHMDWPSVWDAANPMGETMASTLGTSLIMIPIALVGGAILETLPAEQFVRIDWREAGVLEHVVFQTGNYKALLKEMRAITHTKEIDISAEAELIREELAKPDRQSWPASRAADHQWHPGPG